MTRSSWYGIVWLCLCPSLALAQSSSGGEQDYFFSDLGDYLTAPARWDTRDWLTLGAIAGGLAVISEAVDDNWKQEMISEDHPAYYDQLSRLGDRWGTLSLAGPFMLGVYGYGYLTDDKKYLAAGYNIFQAGAYVAISTTALKLAFHRDRPNGALDEAGWFKNGKSFPSGHTSFAFAVSRAYLNSLDDPSLATQAVFYGLSTATAFARTNENKHWVSDVVAGALLGIYTADFVRHQHEQHRGGIAYAPYIGTDTIGIQASW